MIWGNNLLRLRCVFHFFLSGRVLHSDFVYPKWHISFIHCTHQLQHYFMSSWLLPRYVLKLFLYVEYCFPTRYQGTIFRLLLSGPTCLPPIRVCLARFSERQRETGGWQSFRGGRHAQPGYCQSLDFRPDHEASTESRRQWLPVYYAGRRLIRSQRVRAILNKGCARAVSR